MPADYAWNLQRGRGYDVESLEGRKLFEAIAEILKSRRVTPNSAQSNVVAAAQTRGKPKLIVPRIGQQGFRVLVGSAYEYRCAVTGERALPALEAAHILPVAAGGPHLVENGLMLRADLHRLFDAGYLSVDPDDRRLLVSRRIREDFHNGREYYQLHGRELRSPARGYHEPAREFLTYHREKVFLE
ncbi:MAG: HNH endonuclease [Firmicutes bacterium]|nr:HNH endonuclease [Bacillota bacterium]